MTVFQALATSRGLVLQLCRLLGSLKPMKKERLTYGGMGFSSESKHQFIGAKRRSRLAVAFARAQSPGIPGFR